MHVLDQLLQLPYAFVWLPASVFILVAGGCCWLLRPGLQPAQAGIQTEASDIDASLLTKGKPANLRAASRRQGNPVMVYVAAPESKKTPTTGSVLDRSLGGLRLALYQEIEVGTLLAVRPIEANEMVPWVDITVRSCKVSNEMPGHFEVGCEYAKAPPYSIQLLFG